jgi:hypothetical protein
MATDRKHGDRVAFVVGIADYQGAKPLRNAVNDARAIGRELQRLGFAVMGGDNSLGENLDRSAAYQNFEAFCNEIKPGGVALIYYAGHGLQIDDQNYLVPVNARLDGENPLAELVPLRPMIERAARKAGNDGTVLVFLDSCREDPFSADQIRRLAQSARALDPVRTAEHPYSIVNHGFATMKMRPGEDAARTFISFATAPGDFAYDGSGEHSPFTSALLDHIGTRGLALDDFIDRVGLDVWDRAERDGQIQDPWYETNLKQSFYFHPWTLRPIRDLGLLGLIAGLVTCLLLIDAKAEVGSPYQLWWLWGLGLPFGLVVGYGVMRWGSGRLVHALFAVVATMAAFALALLIMQTRVTPAGGQPAEQIDTIKVSLFEGFFLNGRLVGIALLAILAGAVMAVGCALGCKLQFGSFRGFSAATGSLGIGVLLGLVFVGYLVLTGMFLLPNGPVMIGLGTLWFGLLGAQLGYVFALYVPEHRRFSLRR